MPEDVSIRDQRSLTRLFPALRLVGAIRQAFDLRKLIVAALGLALLQPGWTLLDRLVPAAAETTPDLFVPSITVTNVSQPEFWSWQTVSALHFRLTEPVRLLAGPLFAFVTPGADWARLMHSLSSLVWLIAVWGICGGAISRIAIVHAATNRQAGTSSVLRFALANAGPLILAPLCPLLGIAFCALVGVMFGLVYRLPVVGPALAGIGLFFPLAAGLVMTLFLAGLAAGWPLLQAATASGAEDALDALSRIFGYLNQRLGAYAVLVALAWLGGLLGLALVDLLTSGLIHLTHWSLALTAPFDLTEPFFGSDRPTSSSTIASATHAFWLGIVRLFAHAWVFSFFWTAAAYLYLWLRLDVDGTPWSEIDRPVFDPGSSR